MSAIASLAYLDNASSADWLAIGILAFFGIIAIVSAWNHPG